MTNLEEIVGAFGLPEDPRTSPVEKGTVLMWMRSQNIEELGALYAFIFDEPYRRRITPSLELNDYFAFLLAYLRRCLIEDPKGNWPNSRYEAGWDLAKWFIVFWKDPAVPRTRLVEIKTLLAELYLGADDTLRRCLVNATLEHLFEDRKIGQFFNDWKTTPLLSDAFADALLWKAKGGTSSISKGD